MARHGVGWRNGVVGSISAWRKRRGKRRQSGVKAKIWWQRIAKSRRVINLGRREGGVDRSWNKRGMSKGDKQSQWLERNEMMA